VTPTILWLRRDLRLADHPGWTRAREGGGPVIPVFVLDPVLEQSLGAAPAWRLGESLRAHTADLAAKGSRLVLRRGDALATLREVIAETGAKRIVWSRLYDPASIARDKAIKAALTEDGIEGLVRFAHRLWPKLPPDPVARWSGLRPGSPDARPLLGRVAPGCWIATGHHRNGILLAPWTAEVLATWILDDPGDSDAGPFHPDRVGQV